MIAKQGKVEGDGLDTKKKDQTELERTLPVPICILIHNAVLFSSLHSRQRSCVKGQLELWVVYYLYSGLVLCFPISAISLLLVIYVASPVIHQGFVFKTSGFAFIRRHYGCVFTYFIGKIKQRLSQLGVWQAGIGRRCKMSTARDYPEPLNSTRVYL